jgi:hypothetical protein
VSGGPPALHLGEAGPAAIRIPDHELAVQHRVAAQQACDVLLATWDIKTLEMPG